MMSWIETLTGMKWKIISGAAGIALLVAGFFLVVAQVENRYLVKKNVRLEELINDPDTGYIAQLAQANTNVETLTLAVETQNTKLRQQAEESARTLADLKATVARVQNDNARLRTASAKILNGKPRGNTLVERVTDVDNRLLETLK